MVIIGFQIIKVHCKSTKTKQLPRIYYDKNKANRDALLLNKNRDQYWWRFNVIPKKLQN